MGTKIEISRKCRDKNGINSFVFMFSYLESARKVGNNLNFFSYLLIEKLLLLLLFYILMLMWNFYFFKKS